jgi:imidazolonepropionase-like amidohydrolase
MPKRLIIGGTLLMGEKGFTGLPDSVIIIEGKCVKWAGRASELPKGGDFDETIDASGKFIIPGLIDAHTHLGFNGRESLFKLYKDPRDKLILEGIKNVRDCLCSGVTTVRDVGGFQYVDVLLKNGINQGLFEGPRMFVSGKMIAMTGGHCYVIAQEADGVAELKRAARDQLKNGADIIKLMVTGGGATAGQNVEAVQLDLEEVKAAVGVGRSNYRKVAAHAHGASGIKVAVGGGVDGVEHCSFLDEEGADMMVARGTYLVLTLGFESMFDKLDPDWEARMQPVRDRAPQTVALALAKGVKIAAGSDSGGNPYAPHGNFPFILEEMVAHGMTPAQVLKSATIDAADLIGVREKIGSIEAGKFADILILDADPLANISNVRKIAWLFKAGGLISAAFGRGQSRGASA